MRTFFKYSLLLGLALMILGGFSAAGIYAYLKPQLPNPEALRDTRLQVPLRVYSADNQLIAEFGEKRREPVVLAEVPEPMIQAFLAAEDDGFERHVGIDPLGLARAAFELISTGSIQSGGSTITMQVARNYFLSREQTFVRKFKEILLALEIEQHLSKDEILELYLNKIYLGKRAYGVGAAAQIYYGVSLDQLTLAQSAMIAGLPKAPSRFNPVNNPDRALIRRDWILGRMLSLGYIDQRQHDEAISDPITASVYQQDLDFEAPWVAEAARFELEQRLGESIYTDGYRVFLSVNSREQAAAQQAVMQGLLEYDRRHGWRGPEGRIEEPQNYQSELAKLRSDIGGLRPAVVIESGEQVLRLMTADGVEHTLEKSGWSWARARLANRDALGSEPVDTGFLSPGDIVRLPKTGEPILAQLPDAQAAFVAIDPQHGGIRALIGGFDFTDSKFNRALLSNRQVGSGIKPFLYAAAMKAGFTPASIINDAPIIFESGELASAWRPQNSGGKFYGPTRLREALYRSRNLVSVRLLREMGVKPTLQRMNALGLDTSTLPRNLSLALGSGSLSPLQMATGYAIFANGGYQVAPWLIERVENATGRVVLQTRPARACDGLCPEPAVDPVQAAQLEAVPEVRLLSEALDVRWAPQVLEPEVGFLMNSMLRDVVQRGTARRAKALERDDIAGKTGTTNDQVDAWFNGYHPSIVASAWVGLDNPESLGRREYGGAAALPIWIDFMRVALADQPVIELTPPEGVVQMRIDEKTGQPIAGRSGGILEWFIESDELPTQTAQINETDPAPAPLKSNAPTIKDASSLF